MAFNLCLFISLLSLLFSTYRNLGPRNHPLPPSDNLAVDREKFNRNRMYLNLHFSNSITMYRVIRVMIFVLKQMTQRQSIGITFNSQPVFETHLCIDDDCLMFF